MQAIQAYKTRKYC